MPISQARENQGLFGKGLTYLCHLGQRLSYTNKRF